ncbi:MBL fold metallo-hydrolase [Aetokthonos hydrillicola Thurmond2011]|jgi:UDP-MurNAc hydroxylase|uniref:MBL fold metallo-hydrolase n=1 Tax=Aetokthonos hydrillicola Thurmond2011 TaxID=2712845 RepID=A0AAP5IA72_9CYAN|nr:Rieske 2Fe-2S domain-containing protein [Aetokthonos hydrillicola]MBO3460064.1 MBL fold metallo-hydrolase [Aetokthonos hydrillicola CCALA 1050]MBW4589537.1 MBL fold metallo-hydrolase [Aetokthonos hydrillicola CCALA 1050]MDR9896038.1 MBL fold metallo-hydrolase [Aetokthonos hydrillicola Thurmond2011]
MKITSLGHAGLKIETQNATILVDPWLSPEGAFLASWFQYPDNHHLMTPSLLHPTAIAISHEHLDHVDPWFLAQVPEDIPVIIPHYPSPILRKKIATAGIKTIIEVPQWELVQLAEGISLFFVSEESPMNHDSAMVIVGDGEVLLNLNDARLSATQLCTISTKVGGMIDLLAIQGAGASWYPMCYEYPQEKQTELSKRKRIAKLKYLERVLTTIEPIKVLPFAGPPCFLDPDLAWVNTEMEDGIFPDQQQVIDWLAKRGIQNTLLLLPGDAFDITTNKKETDPIWSEFSFSDRDSYLQKYALAKAHDITAFKARYPEPTESLWKPFQNYFQRLLAMSPYFNSKIGMRVGFDIVGAGGGKWAVDFRPGLEAVFEEMGECSYRYRFASRWLLPILNDELPWEDFFLSARFQAWRNPDTYNDHLLGLLKFACPNSLKAVEDYETSMNSNEQITIYSEGHTYQIQRYCPHAGLDLQEVGEILPGGILRCLGHHYEFDLETGKCLNGKCKSLNSQPTQVLQTQ